MPDPRFIPPFPAKAAPPSSDLTSSVVDGLVENIRQEKAETRAQNTSVALWTKVAAIAAIVGAVAAVAAAVLAWLAWRFPMRG